ncbi:MAG: ACT domain-containing protein [Candidatus Nanopelagicales bacterium]
MAALVFETLAAIGVNLDMIVQNVSADGITDITFTLPTADAEKATEALQLRGAEIGFGALYTDPEIAKVSLVGAGMRSHPGVSATFFRTLAEAGVNVEMISTSEIRISVVTRKESAAAAVKALHTAFGLDAEGEAVVYAGTGR